MSEKPKYANVTTPKGEAIFPWISRPDTKFDQDGVYVVTLKLTEDEAQPVIEAMDAEAKSFYDSVVEDMQAKKKNKQARELKQHVPYEYEEDDDGNQTGYVLVKAKQKAVIRPEGQDPVSMAPKVFDSSKKELKKVPKIGSGSQLKLSGQLVPFHNAAISTAGLTFRLKAVQVIDLSGGGPGADAFGFDDEDGFSGDDAPAEEESGEQGSDDDGDNEGDF